MASTRIWAARFSSAALVVAVPALSGAAQAPHQHVSASGEASLNPRRWEREAPLSRDGKGVAVLVVDMQNFCCHEHGPVVRDLAPEARAHVLQRLRSEVLPNQLQLLKALSDSHGDIVFTTIESLTMDGRDRSLDYKISGFNVPRGSWGGKILQALDPEKWDSMLLTKTSSSPFVSTSIAYVLRNLGVRQLIIVGGLTDQCVDSAVRDACDEGFLVTLVPDACYSHSHARHNNALDLVRGYCRMRTTKEVLEELSAQGPEK
uniref:Isochorismatase-like domain-containing protein n=1 Tax=Rhizochromulina marina TaxID=1034831 RepID=A0A7S2S5T8_9STRA|mmetsp:Transcript_25547/g.74538  ORF Transcript_25547/g.74538 Transcript_25547/m.74538 type:complete len:261 (+) Transcript_25547:246-1028(+)